MHRGRDARGGTWNGSTARGGVAPWLGLALALVLAAPAWGQPAADEPADEPTVEPRPRRPGQRGAVEEIVVTATKREESLQDIPVAVSAFQGEELIDRGIYDLQGLQQVSPSLSVYGSNSDSGGGTLRIRGMGTTGNNPGLESAVGYFVDGVYRSRSGQGFNDLLDVERVEILRGPQGTLFGKNTSAGAVHIITARPQFEWNAYVSASAGNLDLRRTQASITGPLLGDVLAFRLAANIHERDGFYEELGSFEHFSNLDRWSIRGQLLFQPTEEFSARLIADFIDKDESCCPAAFREVGALGALVAGFGGDVDPSNENDKQVGLNFDPVERITDWGLSLEMNWELGFGTLTSLTAYRRFKAEREQDLDFSSADILLPQDEDEIFRNFSEELRLTGATGPLDWLVGVYAYNEALDADGDVRFSSLGPGYFAALNAAAIPAAFPPGPASVIPGNLVPGVGCPAGELGCGYGEFYNQDTTGWAIFTQNTWHLTEDLSVTAGARYNWEEKDAEGVINDAAFGNIANESWCTTGTGVPGSLVARATPFWQAFCDNQSFDDDRLEQEWTYTGKLAYQVMEGVNVYTSFTRGYKAGGFNLDQQAAQLVPVSVGSSVFVPDPTIDLQFEEEKNNAYEVGVKSTWWDGRLTLNTAVFFTEFKNFQLNTFTGTGFIITNVPKVKSRGAELEGFLDLAEGVDLSFGVTYADTRYGDNLTDSGTPGASSMPPSSVAANLLNLEGQRITHAPPWTGSAAIFVDRPLPGSDWRYIVNTNVSYRGRHNTGSDLDPPKKQAAYTLWNASLGVRSPDDRWEVTVWGYNLFDRHYDTLVFDSVLQPGNFSTFFGPPRTYGVTVTFRLY